MSLDSTTILPSTPPAIVQVDLQTIAQQIADEHEACSAAARQSLQHAMRCGDLLLQAKRECGHGKFSPWLADNFPGSKRTAQVYMRLAKNRATVEAKSAESALLSIDEAVKLLAEPKGPQIEIPALDGTTGYVGTDPVGGVWQLWPSSRSSQVGPCYYANYAEPTDDGGASEVFSLKPLSADGVRFWLRHRRASKIEWQAFDEPVLQVDEWKPVWPERHEVEAKHGLEKRIEDLDLAGSIASVGKALREVRDKKLWRGCFASFYDYTLRRFGLDVEATEFYMEVEQ